MWCETVSRMLCTGTASLPYGSSYDQWDPSSNRIPSRRIRRRNFWFSNEPFRCGCVRCFVMTSVCRIRGKTSGRPQCANTRQCQWWFDRSCVVSFVLSSADPLGHRGASSRDFCTEWSSWRACCTRRTCTNCRATSSCDNRTSNFGRTFSRTRCIWISTDWSDAPSCDGSISRSSGDIASSNSCGRTCSSVAPGIWWFGWRGCCDASSVCCTCHTWPCKIRIWMVWHRSGASVCARPISGDRNTHSRNIRSTMRTTACVRQSSRCRRRAADGSDRWRRCRCRKSCSSIHTSAPNWPPPIRAMSYACAAETAVCTLCCTLGTRPSFHCSASRICDPQATFCRRMTFRILDMIMVVGIRNGCGRGDPIDTMMSNSCHNNRKNARKLFRAKTSRDCRSAPLLEMSVRKWCTLSDVDSPSEIADEINICNSVRRNR